MTLRLENSWLQAMAPEFEKQYWHDLAEFVKSEYQAGVCYPDPKHIFGACDATPFEKVKVVILGQDPYHNFGAAMGLAFSVPDGYKIQPSLKNIFKELKTDTGIGRTLTDLTDWASQGVFLLNSVLTVRSNLPASHQKKGWETFTDAVISTISHKQEGIIFVLWGNYAISKRSLIDETRHKVITSSHPSPFSAYNGFFGSRPFSQINEYLESQEKTPIIWG